MLMIDGDLSSPPMPYRSRWILAQAAEAGWQERGYYALRREVFVREQALFQESDRDDHDRHALPIVALSTCSGVPDDVVGVVRIYREADVQHESLWFGGRLAVAPAYRRSAEVGAALIRAAVGAARGLGATRFLATVQQDNVPYFVRQGFRSLAPVVVCDRPHQLMQADLATFAVPAWLERYSACARRAA